jgi:hypothetical protein
MPSNSVQAQTQARGEATDNSQATSAATGATLDSSLSMIPIDEASALRLLDNLTDKTAGLTLEQLEQVNRELMAAVWETRGEANRSRVLSAVTAVFNQTLSDIKAQGKLQMSQ